MRFLKKYYKLIGTIVTVIALVFVVKKIVTMDVDWSMFASGRLIAMITGCVLIQTAVILFMSMPWVRFVRILSGTNIPMKDALPVYTKSNLMKYVPGNVFQYVGRNQLAADLHISHVDVACATVLDIVCSMLTPLLLIVVLMGKNMLELIRTYRNNFLIVLGVGVAVLLLLFLVLRWKFREPLQRYFEKYRKLLNRKILLRVLGVFLLYVVQYIISTAMYAIPAAFLFDVPGDKLGLFLGTYLFSWIVGFITPGAPGGIGIREAVMIMMCGQLSGYEYHYAVRRHPADHFHLWRYRSVSDRNAAGAGLETAKTKERMKKAVGKKLPAAFRLSADALMRLQVLCCCWWMYEY